MLNRFSRKQKKGLLKIFLVLFGILIFPILVNRLLGIETMNVLMVVVAVYAVIAWKMSRS